MSSTPFGYSARNEKGYGLPGETKGTPPAPPATDQTPPNNNPPHNNPPPRNNPPPQRSPDPSVSSVTFNNITQTSADATVSIENAGTSGKTVRLHFRVDGANSWGKAKSENTSGSSATMSLTGLSAGTPYEVQAWLNASSPPSGIRTYTFATLEDEPEPNISDLAFEDVAQTSVTAMVKIADAGTDMKTGLSEAQHGRHR